MFLLLLTNIMKFCQQEKQLLQRIEKVIIVFLVVRLILFFTSSWDYGTSHTGDQRRLRQACASAQSRQSFRCSHTWSMEADEGSDQKSNILLHWMAAHACLKDEFKEDEKYHNFKRWLFFALPLRAEGQRSLTLAPPGDHLSHTVKQIRWVFDIWRIIFISSP